MRRALDIAARSASGGCMASPSACTPGTTQGADGGYVFKSDAKLIRGTYEDYAGGSSQLKGRLNKLSLDVVETNL